MEEKTLSDMPEAILIDILSKLHDRGEVVRSSVLSKQWHYLWRYVPFSLDFYRSPYSKNNIADFVASSHRELHYLRFFQNVPEFNVYFNGYEECYVKDVDLWLHFATQVATVQELTLLCDGDDYELPQFAYKNKSLWELILDSCILNPSGSVNWTNLVTLSVGYMNFSDGVLEKVLSGCPNLETLKIKSCFLHSLEIPTSSVKLREVIIEDSPVVYDNNDIWLEIFAPFVQNLQILGLCNPIRLRNVASLVVAVLDLGFCFYCDDEGNSLEIICLKELLHSVVHVENLELSPWCTECLSILELKGWQFPPSSRKILKLETPSELWNSPGISSFLQSSSELETLVIYWCNCESNSLLSRYTNEDELSRRFETCNLNCSLPHLKTIKFFSLESNNKIVLPLAKYLLKNAIVLEKFIIRADARYGGSREEYVKIEEELQSFPRSSQLASVVFSYE